jgi:glutathione S-transferase
MGLTLYHSVESTCSQKVRFVMSEKKLDWQQHNINLRKGEQFNPDYLKLNPKAVVPTLVHDERVIRESTVVIEYLDDVFPEPPLKPGEPYQRALMRLLLKAFDEEVHPSVGILSYAIVLRHQMNGLKTPEQMQEHFKQIVDPMRRQRQQSTHHEGLKAAAASQAVTTLSKVVALLAEIKGSNSWLCGSDFSLADATAAPYMMRIKNIGMGVLWDEKPEIGEWLEAVIKRVNSYSLEDAWGSESFHAMVSGYVQKSKQEIEKLVEERL